jgi:predicted ATPase
MPIWENSGRIFRAWANWPTGDRQSELVEMRYAVERLRELGQGWSRQYSSALLAEAEADAGRADIALAKLDEILTETSATEQRMFDAELHRIRGEVLLQRDPANTAHAEEAYLSAIAIAQQQKAKSFELRAALSLAKLSIESPSRRGPCRACACDRELFAYARIPRNRRSASVSHCARRNRRSDAYRGPAPAPPKTPDQLRPRACNVSRLFLR